MAAITPTIDTISPVGEHAVMTGYFTGVDADSHIAVVPTTGTVLAFSISTPAQEATTPLVVLNASTGGAVNTTQGSVRVDQTTTGIYTFIAHVVGAF